VSLWFKPVCFHIFFDMKIRRKTEGLNIAFLDVMASGLGAIILVLKTGQRMNFMPVM